MQPISKEKKKQNLVKKQIILYQSYKTDFKTIN